MAASEQVKKRAPFGSDSSLLDLDIFAKSYACSLRWVCEVTPELLSYEGMPFRARNFSLASFAANGQLDIVLGALGQPLRAAHQALGAIAGGGEYVQKNIPYVLARQLPGSFSEITCQDIPESWVGVGPGGAEFAELAGAGSDPGDWYRGEVVFQGINSCDCSGQGLYRQHSRHCFAKGYVGVAF